MFVRVSVFPAAGHTVTRSRRHTVISSWRQAAGAWRRMVAGFPEGTKGTPGTKGGLATKGT